jgi:hypothetical protein
MDTDQETGVDAMDALVDALDDPEHEATVDDGEDSSLDDSGDDDGEQESQPELVDLDGKRVEIPPGTPPALVDAVKKMTADLKADYTRKTQGAAEAARSVQMKEANLQLQEQFIRANSQRMAQLTNAQERLTQYDQIDWQGLIDADPVHAQKLQVSFQQERRAAEQLHQQMLHDEDQRRQAAAAYQMQRVAEGAALLHKQIPKWGDDKKRQVLENALTYGYSREEFDGLSDPRHVMVLHDAAQWRALQAQKKTAMQKVTDAPRVVRPGTAPTQQPKSKSAFDRLRKSGRVEDLASLL